MKKLLIIAVLVLGAFHSSAQQDAMYTHYAFNTMSVNPAYAGSREMLSMTLLHRSQWIGFDGAPMSQTFTANTPLVNGHMGLGISLQNDRIGPLNAFTGNVDLAYRMKINENNKLSFGLKAGVNIYDRNLRDLAAYEDGDNAINNSAENEYLLDIGAGLLYTNKDFYMGISVPRLFTRNFNDITSAHEKVGAKEMHHYYFTAGTMFKLSKQLDLRPSTFIRATKGVPMVFDLTTMFVINKKIEVGAMWRSNDAFGLLLGYTFMENLRVGYSFDFSYSNKTFTNNYGSHELMLRYDLFYKKNGEVVSPRYF